MDASLVLNIGRDFMWAVLLLTMPSLLVSLVVGLIIAIFQTITSIQEQTLSFAPRLIAVGVVIAFTMSWAMQIAVQFTTRMFLMTSEVIR